MDHWIRVFLVGSIIQLWVPATAVLDSTNYDDLVGTTCYNTIDNTLYAGVDPDYLASNQPAYNFSQLDLNVAHTYMAENRLYMFKCCGLVTEWKVYAGGNGTLHLQVWRRTSDTVYKLIGVNYCRVNFTNAVKTCDVKENDRILVRKGDIIGWYNPGNDLIKYYTDLNTTGNYPSYSNRLENLFRRTNIRGAYEYDWSTVDAYNDRVYAIQAKYERASTAPKWYNIPTDLKVPDYIIADYPVPNYPVARFFYNDSDHNDNSSLIIVTLSESVFYSTDLPSGHITTNNAYRQQPGVGQSLSYFVYDLCYNYNQTSIDMSIVTTDINTDSSLDATITISVNDKEERLLHTIVVTDPTDETWCEKENTGDWGYTTDTPFMLIALTNISRDVEYGLYLVAGAKHTELMYTLPIKCWANNVEGTMTETATGTVTVYVTGNEPPVFTNLDGTASVDAEIAKKGDVVFTVSASDPEGDVLHFTAIVCKRDGITDTDDTFMILDNGQVILTSFLSRSTYYQYDCEVTVEDTSPTSDPDFPVNELTGNLHIYVSNTNNPVTIKNMPLSEIQIQENMPVGTSLWKFEYLDLDDGDLDVKTWSMKINDPATSRYFHLNPETGLFSLAFSEINYLDTAAAGTSTLTFTITVGDVKSEISREFTVSIINENEPPWFTRDFYVAQANEGSDGNSVSLIGDTIQIEDEDLDEVIPLEDHTYSFDCDNATNTHRFYMDKGTGAITFQGDYDLDIAGTPSDFDCTITVTDEKGLSDTAKIYIHINNVNEYTPEFTRSSYTFYLPSTTLVGTYLDTLSAVDLDSSDDDDNVITYAIDPSAPNLIAIDNDGSLYLINDLSPDTDTTIEVRAMNYNHATPLTGTITVTISVPATTTTSTTTTTDRNTGFYEDQWSYYWLLATLIGATLIIVAVSVVFYRICRLTRIGPYCYALCCIRPPKPLPPRGFGDKGYDLASFGHRHRYTDEDEEMDGWMKKKRSKKVEHFATTNDGYESLTEARPERINEMFRVPSVPNPANYLEPHRGTRQPQGGDRWKDRNKASRR